MLKALSSLGEVALPHADQGADAQVFKEQLENTHAKLRSVLRRIVELERRLGVMRDNRFLRCERIQLGLEISVTGERGVSASEFPYMMVLLALIVVVISIAYKFFAFSKSA